MQRHCRALLTSEGFCCRLSGLGFRAPVSGNAAPLQGSAQLSGLSNQGFRLRAQGLGLQAWGLSLHELGFSGLLRSPGLRKAPCPKAAFRPGVTCTTPATASSVRGTLEILERPLAVLHDFSARGGTVPTRSAAKTATALVEPARRQRARARRGPPARACTRRSLPRASSWRAHGARGYCGRWPSRTRECWAS